MEKNTDAREMTTKFAVRNGGMRFGRMRARGQKLMGVVSERAKRQSDFWLTSTKL